jgi:hypothetical protein
MVHANFLESLYYGGDVAAAATATSALGQSPAPSYAYGASLGASAYPPPPPPSADDTHCFVETHDAWRGAEVLTILAILAFVAGAIPQYIKLIVLATDKGNSLTALALLNVSAVTATLNIFILHYEQIKQCVRGDMGFDDCNTSLLTFYYTATWTILWFPVYTLAARYCSDEETEEVCGATRTRRQNARIGFWAHVIPCVGLAAPVVGMVLRGNCYEYEVRSSHTGSHTTALAW